MHPNSPILASCPPRPARSCGRPAQAAPIRIGRPSAIHKKLQSPQSHISQATHCSPCLADPHAPRIPIRSISPYVLRGSAIQSASSKNLTLILTRPAFRRRRSPTNPDQQMPWICVTSPQIQRRPSPANPTYLRLGVAPARTRARPWACTRTSVPWSYLHGHARAFTAMVMCLRARSRRDQRGRLWQIHASNPSTQIPTSNDWGAWASGHGIASRCGDDVDDRRRGVPACPPDSGLLRYLRLTWGRCEMH